MSAICLSPKYGSLLKSFMNPTRQPKVPAITCLLVRIIPLGSITVPEPWLALCASTGHKSLTVDFIIESWFMISSVPLGGVCGVGLLGGSQYWLVVGGAVWAVGQSKVIEQLLFCIPDREHSLHVPQVHVSAVQDGGGGSVD